MSIPYKISGPVEIDADKLIFWPNNPRLKISDFREVGYTERQLLEPANQRNIFKLLSKHEDHDVITLVKSMSKVGFMREKAPIVMKVEGFDRYLVLEGNRRLTAIRTILEDRKAAISKENRASLERIPCWVFQHTLKSVPLKAAISRMVAEAHIKGQKAHTKLQRAHMVYDAYLGFLDGGSEREDFRLDKETLHATSDFFDIPCKELECDLSVVSLYKQILEFYDIEDVPKKCSERLSWVHQNPGHFSSYFQYDPILLIFDDEGLERFYDVFLHPDAAVFNPAEFKKFREIMRDGTNQDVECIRENPECLDEVYTRIKEEKVERRFLSGLERIERRLSSLRVSDFQGEMDEFKAIDRIIDLVDKKLRRLREDDEPGDVQDASKPRTFKKPRDIQEAISLGYPSLSDEIDKVIRSRRNSTCEIDKVPTLLLKRWGVVSRGRPREVFCECVKETIERMFTDGRLSK